MQAVGSFVDHDIAVAVHPITYDRRREDRKQARVTVRVAYARGAVLPADGNLVEVERHNLSRSGFAYWIVSPPEHKEILVVFGEEPKEVRVRGRVIHTEVVERDLQAKLADD